MAELKNPSFELPEGEPHAAESTVAEQPAEGQKAVVETGGTGRESAAGKQVAQIYAQPQMQTLADDDQPAAAPAPAQPMTADDKIIQKLPAKDGDLIEKEWVERAKSIIARTADDPHKQKHEVSKMKAAYIQKRFNKIVKNDEAKTQD